MDAISLQTAALLFAVTLAGALLPLHRRWSERWLHLFVSLSAGVFLGTVFLHLLPHLAGVELGGDGTGTPMHLGDLGDSGAVPPSLAPWIAALAGLLLLFVIEKVWLRRVADSSAPDPHRALWVATWVGLGMHSLSEGIALAAILEQSSMHNQILFPVLVHKATEAFSLATVMRLARLGNLRTVLFLALFALLGPIGIVLGRELISSSGSLDLVLTGFACGTFIYVAVCDLLPEVFHGVDRPALKLASVGAGVLATALTLPGLARGGEFATRVGQESLAIFVELSPYLLMGFLIAGILSQVIKPHWLTRHVASENLKSATIASLIGAPLPLCSCAVVPVAVSMRKSGASKGATTSFLIATPETGVDSITVSWALLGPILTLARVAGAIVSAIFVGTVVSGFVRRGFDRAAPPVSRHAAPQTEEACGHAGAETSPRSPTPERSWLTRVLRYAFVEMMDDLSGSLVVGILLSGVIAAAVPAAFFESPLATGFPGMLLMLVAGIPIYVCAAACTPIAAALILKGMSPGAVFVFLLASPATNLGSLIVLTKHLGRRVVIVMVIALAVITLALGWVVDLTYRWLGVVPAVSLGPGAEHLPEWLALAAAGLLGLLLLVSIVRTRGAVRLFGGPSEHPQPAAR